MIELLSSGCLCKKQKCQTAFLKKLFFAMFRFKVSTMNQRHYLMNGKENDLMLVIKIFQCKPCI